MTSRILALAASALILSAGLVSADAATHRRSVRHHAAPHSTMRGQAAMRHRGGMRSGMAMRAPRGRDAESASVDQLNAQSLNAARGGAAPAAAAPQ